MFGLIRIHSKWIRIRSQEGQNNQPVQPNHESNPDAQDGNTTIRADASVSVSTKRYCGYSGYKVRLRY
jgi:hypothetical protein